MWQHYYLNRNAQSTGEHEIHKQNCYRRPQPQNEIYLGYFYDAKHALIEAKKYYTYVDGCYYCCSEIHKK